MELSPTNGRITSIIYLFIISICVRVFFPLPLVVAPNPLHITVCLHDKWLLLTMNRRHSFPVEVVKLVLVLDNNHLVITVKTIFGEYSCRPVLVTLSSTNTVHDGNAN